MGRNIRTVRISLFKEIIKKTSFDADEVVFIGYGIQDPKHNDLSQVDIKGKVVLLINESEPKDAQGNSIITGTKKESDWSTSRFKRLQALVKLQPKLILATGGNAQELIARFGARMSGGRFTLDNGNTATPGTEQPPVVHIKPEIADLLLQTKGTTIAQQKQKPTTFSFAGKLRADMGLINEKYFDPNVLGLLEGSDLKDEIVVVSGHYDHDGIMPDGTIFPGADDNGSGTTGVLELARVFAEAKKRRIYTASKLTLHRFGGRRERTSRFKLLYGKPYLSFSKYSSVSEPRYDRPN